MWAIYVGVGDPHSGSHACWGSILPAEPSPGPKIQLPFCHVSNEQSENNVEEANLFTTASRRTKILRVHLTKEVQELLHDSYVGNYLNQGQQATIHRPELNTSLCCREFRGHAADMWPKTAFFNFWYLVKLWWFFKNKLSLCHVTSHVCQYLPLYYKDRVG